MKTENRENVLNILFRLVHSSSFKAYFKKFLLQNFSENKFN